MISILKLMQTKLDNILKTALARPSLQSVDREELLLLTHEFPYAPILQFLYTKRLQQSQDPRFGDSVTKTALFFNNPHWLFQQLRDNTPAELVRTMEEQSLQPSGDLLPHDIHQETIEDENIAVNDLTASELELIASITEAPDGSLIKDEAVTLAEETAENEFGEQPLEVWESTSDDTSTEEPVVFETDEELDLTESTEQETETNLVEDELETPPDIDSYTDDLTEPTEPLDVTSIDDDLVANAEDAIELSQLSTASLTESPSSYTIESSEEILPAVAVEEPEIKEEAAAANTSTPGISSLITVISSVGTFGDHPIHTIGIDRTAVQDDASMPIALETSQSDETIDEAASSLDDQSQEFVVDTTFESSFDNDDDTATMLSNESSDHTMPDPIESDEIVADEPLLSGLENLGFLPETLLEESGATEAESDTEGAANFALSEPVEGWDDFQFMANTDENDDHPDATDRGEDDGEDQDGPFINPGDLIKMAGLDQYNETELSFEPLHLTDYFASVGVSLPTEEQPDMFGRQSRSFTGWIKSMKRIHPEKNSVVVSFTQTESESIRAEAEQSNEQEDVLTETMADIYALQGLTHKAIDIYEKLSLLNPEKSATFAAKLSELKGKLP